MSTLSQSEQDAIFARALERCEYCHSPITGQIGRFHIDHILPESEGGSTSSENLALACPRCNAHKAAKRVGIDPVNGTEVPLFHPRQDDWNTHFRWSVTVKGVLDGLTPKGRATIERLRLNGLEWITLRRFLIEMGTFTEIPDPEQPPA